MPTLPFCAHDARQHCVSLNSGFSLFVLPNTKILFSGVHWKAKLSFMATYSHFSKESQKAVAACQDTSERSTLFSPRFCSTIVQMFVHRLTNTSLHPTKGSLSWRRVKWTKCQVPSCGVSFSVYSMRKPYISKRHLTLSTYCATKLGTSNKCNYLACIFGRSPGYDRPHITSALCSAMSKRIFLCHVYFTILG